MYKSGSIAKRYFNRQNIISLSVEHHNIRHHLGKSILFIKARTVPSTTVPEWVIDLCSIMGFHQETGGCEVTVPNVL